MELKKQEAEMKQELAEKRQKEFLEEQERNRLEQQKIAAKKVSLCFCVF